MTARRDRGETLVELLVTVVVLGTAVVALVAGLATAIRMSDIHRKQATAGAYVKEFAETIEASVAADTTGYHACAGTGTYAGLYSTPAPYVAEVTDVDYWDGTSAFTEDCTTDTGVQRLSLVVTATNSQVSESLDVIIRRPCRPGEGDDECV